MAMACMFWRAAACCVTSWLRWLHDLCLSTHWLLLLLAAAGNNNKINWAMNDKQEFVDIVETVYRGARKGRGLVVSPKDYSTKYRY
jgi:hypothetical protein